MDEPCLNFRILGVDWAVDTSRANKAARFWKLAEMNFSAYLANPSEESPFFSLRSSPDGTLTLASTRSGVIWESGSSAVEDDYHFLYALEKELTLELQRLRSDLYFVHAAVLERNGRCLLIAAESGTGKSTLAFALQSRDWRYMSDELAPINIADYSVFPYRHALCLKSVPPEPYSVLPPHVATDRTLHISPNGLNSVDDDRPQPLGGLVFLRRDNTTTEPAIRKISAAEATARLYGNTLNALAHSGSGLDAAAAIAERLPAWHLDVANLEATCKIVDEVGF